MPLPDLARRLRAELVLLELDLSRGLRETAPADALAAVRNRHVPSLESVLNTLREAGRHRHVVGLVAHVGPPVLDPAQVEELGAGVEAFAATGRTTACWTESFGELGAGTVSYLLAAHFDQLWVQPSGTIGLVGVATRGVFVRGALDRLGIEPQVAQRHEYKSAADLLLRDQMSEPNREATQRLTDSVTEQVVATVARRRSLSQAQVRAAVDAAPLTPEQALRLGLVDRIGYRDQLYAELRRRLSAAGRLQLRYVHRWRQDPASRANAALRRRPVVAVVRVEGAIELGRSSGSPLGVARAGADTVCSALRTAARRPEVAAVVLRVVSPGGSYVASDAIHREVLQVRDSGRPIVASMGSVAASGGYFVAMPADEIVALPTTVTGSIGVLGGKLVVGEALRRIGVTTEPVGAGAQATMFDPVQRFDEDQWRRIEQWLDAAYDDFVRRAAAGRGMPVERLEPLARGRVWTGADARERGLVDHLGGLEEAVCRAADRAGRSRTDIRVERVPRLALVDRVRPARSSEDAAAAVGTATATTEALVSGLLQRLGLPGTGVLSLASDWRLTG